VTSPETPPPEPTTPVLSDTGHDATESVTWPVRVAAAWSWRLVVVVAAGYLIVRAVSAVHLVAFSLIIALFLTAILHPLKLFLGRHITRPRSASVALTVLIGVALLGGVGYFVAWQITMHATQLGNQVTDFADKARDWLQNGPLHLKPSDLNNLVNNVTNWIKTHEGQLLSGAVDTVRTLGEVLGAFLLILLSTFFMLRDGEQIWQWFLGFFPRAAHERVNRAAHIGWRTFGGYMHGVVLIALFHGVTVSIVLLILRVPLAAALGVMIFLGSFIPLIGITVTGALCVAVATLEHGITSGIVVAIAIVALVQIEGHVLQPVIMSRTVHVHPLAVAVSVFAGTALAGIPGALIAVPFVAFVNTTVRALRAPLDEPEAEIRSEAGFGGDGFGKRESHGVAKAESHGVATSESEVPVSGPDDHRIAAQADRQAVPGTDRRVGDEAERSFDAERVLDDGHDRDAAGLEEPAVESEGRRLPGR
jgi:putative heme transporter